MLDLCANMTQESWCIYLVGKFQRERRLESRMEEQKTNDQLFIELAEKNGWTKCPSCEYFVERIEGCKRMLCRFEFSSCFFPCTKF